MVHARGVRPSPFRELGDIYKMSDADLMRAVNDAERRREKHERSRVKHGAAAQNLGGPKR